MGVIIRLIAEKEGGRGLDSSGSGQKTNGVLP